MAHIQQGDQRQYFASEAPVDFSGQVANVLGQGLNTGVSITQKANESTMASNQIDLSTKFLAKNNEINTKWQADPTNPQREIELKQAFESLAEEYKINPVCQKQWADIKTNVYDRYKTYNAQWQEKQLQTNAQISLKDGYEKSIYNASQLGRNNASLDAVRLCFANEYEALKNGATSQLGEVVVGEALNKYKHDYMTEYLDGLMENNPAQALALINDKNSGIANDLEDEGTLQKLKQSAQQKLLRKSEVDAVDRVAGLVNSNATMFEKAFNGTITTVEAQNLLQSNNVDRNMRKILSQMLGYSATSDYSVDIETGKIEKKEDSSSDSGAGSEQDMSYSELVIGNKKWTFLTKKGKVRQATPQEKDEITNELFIKGSQLLNGIQNATPQQAIRKVAEFQSQVAQARYFGIDKGDYNKLMSDFVLPATENIQTEAKDYNGKAHWWGHHQYGYSQIETYFKDKFSNKNGDLSEEGKKEQALASVYYWSALNNECSQRGIKMSDLKNLSGEEKAGLYSKCAKNAIAQASATSANPSVWFRATNPQYVSAIRSMLPNQNANNVITNIAVSAMSNPSMSEKDFNAIIDREVKNEYAKMRTSNKAIVMGNNTKYDEYINKYAMLYGVDPLLIKCIIRQESGFNTNAKSKAGAGGLMQLMPSTARGLGVKNIYDPKENISAGTKYFANLLHQFNGNVPLALASYNAGAGAVKKYGNKIPPYKETQNYVKNIMANYNKVKG